MEGMEQPAYCWDPVIAPSGMTFYTGDLFPEWQDNLFIASLNPCGLVRLMLDGKTVIGEERLLEYLGACAMLPKVPMAPFMPLRIMLNTAWCVLRRVNSGAIDRLLLQFRLKNVKGFNLLG